MLQTFHAVPFRSTVQLGAAVNVINGLMANTTAAIEIDNDFDWLLAMDSGR